MKNLSTVEQITLKHFERLAQGKDINGRFPKNRWEFPSSSSSKIYTTMRHEDGHLSCNCPGWCFKKNGKDRSCKHTNSIN